MKSYSAAEAENDPAKPPIEEIVDEKHLKSLCQQTWDAFMDSKGAA